MKISENFAEKLPKFRVSATVTQTGSRKFDFGNLSENFGECFSKNHISTDLSPILPKFRPSQTGQILRNVKFWRGRWSPTQTQTSKTNTAFTSTGLIFHLLNNKHRINI